MNLFLDDCRQPHQVNWVELPLVEWIVVKNYEEFVRRICSFGVPQRVSFDNDLADSHYEALKNGDFQEKQSTNLFVEKTGYDCLKWLANYCIERGEKFPEYYIHTMNPIGRENMEKYLENFFRNNANLQG